LRDHPDAVEAALWIDGGQVDLLDLWRGTLTLRRLSILIAHLPPGNAIDRVIDPDDAMWRRGEVNSFLLAHIAQVETPQERRLKEEKAAYIRSQALSYRSQMKDRAAPITDPEG
jgi:hypothetical protein